MSISSGFFESNIDESGEYDRVYYAHQFAHYFSQFISNGVFGNPTNQLQVMSADNHSMDILVNIGNAFIKGFWFYSSEIETLTLANASGVYPRWDAIVVGYSALNREIKLYVKQGNYAEEPTKPTMSKTDDLYELCLGYVYVAENSTEVTDKTIVDTRPDENLCGFVTGMVQQLNTNELFRQYKTLFDSWFMQMKAELEGIMNDVIQSPEVNMQGFTLLFNAWFDTIKGQITSDASTAITQRINNIERRMYGYETKQTTFNEDGSILELYETGNIKTTVFEVDGRITERTFDKNNLLMWKKTTTFNEDGSISENVEISN